MRSTVDGGVAVFVGARQTPGDALDVQAVGDGSYLVADTTSVLRVWLED